MDTSPATVAEWHRRIEDRLSGRVVNPQIPPRSEDGLETFLVDYYGDASTAEKKIIEEAVLELLLSARRASVPRPWLGYLFHFIRLSRMEAVSDQLVALFLADAKRGNPLRSAAGAYQTSQLHELMHAIRALFPKVGPLSWAKYLDDPDLAQFAYYGLVESDLDAALKALPTILRQDESIVPVSKRNCLAYLLGHWRSERLRSEPVAALLLFFDQQENAKWSGRVRDLLREIPSAHPYVAAYEMTHEVGIEKKLFSEDDWKKQISVFERFMFTGFRTTWDVLMGLRKALNCSEMYANSYLNALDSVTLELCHANAPKGSLMANGE